MGCISERVPPAGNLGSSVLTQQELESRMPAPALGFLTGWFPEWPAQQDFLKLSPSRLRAMGLL